MDGGRGWTLSIGDPEGAPISLLRYTNEGSSAFRYVPRSVQVRALPPEPAPPEEPSAVRLDLPAGWEAVPSSAQILPPGASAARWTVFPRGDPSGWSHALRLSIGGVGGFREVAIERLGVEVVGVSQFDPGRHGLPWANAVDELGAVEPSRRVFGRTYRRSLLGVALFAGLYRAIVFLSDRPGGYQGGICTGTARLALERSLRAAPIAGLRDEAIVLHGRQLTDRALLAAVPWFLDPSPRRAFERFREDVLRRCRSDVCFDVGVPRPWRRDIGSALLSQGHTVVPFRFWQSSAERAEVTVYDPNHPRGPEAERSIVSFDLAGDTYEYGSLAHLSERKATVVAVRQPAYRFGRTTYLAGLANLLLFPGSLRAAACRKASPRRGDV